MGTLFILEILDWAFLIAALVVLVLQFSTPAAADRTGSTYRTLNVLFWIFMTACFLINGLESVTWFRWVWFLAAVASFVGAFVPPRGSRPAAE